MRKNRFMILCLALAAVFLLQILAPAMAAAEEAEIKAVALSTKKATLYVGDTLQLKLTGTKEKVTWSSSSEKVATVSKTGLVTAEGTGKAKITAKAGGKKYTCKITVKSSPLAISKTKLTMKAGQKATLSITWGNRSLEHLDVSCNNSSAVSFSLGKKSGTKVPLNVNAVGAGEAVITVMDTSTWDSVELKITVVDDKISISFQKTPFTITQYAADGKTPLLEYKITKLEMKDLQYIGKKYYCTVEVSGKVLYDYRGGAHQLLISWEMLNSKKKKVYGSIAGSWEDRDSTIPFLVSQGESWTGKNFFLYLGSDPWPLNKENYTFRLTQPEVGEV